MRKQLLVVSIILIMALTSVSVWAEQTVAGDLADVQYGADGQLLAVDGLAIAANTGSGTDQGGTVAELSLENAIQLAVENNNNLKLLRYELDKNKLNNDSAKGSFDSAIDGAISKVIQDTKDDMGGVLPPGMEDAIAETIRNEASNSKYEMTQLLDDQTTITQNDYIKAEREIKFNVQKLYNESLKTQALIEIAQANIDRIETQYKQAENRYELGLISKRDLIDIEVSLAQANANLVQAEAGKKTIDMNLNRLMNVDTDNKYLLTSQIEAEIQPSIYELDADIERALANNPAMTTARAQLALTKYNRDNNARGYYGYESAKIQVKQVELQLVEAEENLKMQIMQAYMNINSSYEQYLYLAQARDQAAESLHLAELNYDVGLITNYELQGARLAHLSAENDYITAIYDYQLAQLDYELMVGLAE